MLGTIHSLEKSKNRNRCGQIFAIILHLLSSVSLLFDPDKGHLLPYSKKMFQKLQAKSKQRRRLLEQQLGVSGRPAISQLLGSSFDQFTCPDTFFNSLNVPSIKLMDKPDQLITKTIDTACSTPSSSVPDPYPLISIDHHPTSSIPVALPLPTYTDSSTFLKGTQSANPHNDYCQHFVDTGQRPQNFIRNVGLNDRFDEYPKLKELIRLKDELVASTACPPMYLKADLRLFDLATLDCQFDVILVEPPLEEYQRACGVTNLDFWSWDEIINLNIERVASPRSFVFLWCGSSDGLDLGRQCLKKWGFRRCEDICWIKTNSKSPGHSNNLEPNAIFQRTKEHCLMGIKGTVRRSTDGHFIHANIDIDLIITEQPEYGSIEKPQEMVHIIEHFCLGKRRLHVFGRDSTIRPGNTHSEFITILDYYTFHDDFVEGNNLFFSSFYFGLLS